MHYYKNVFFLKKNGLNIAFTFSSSEMSKNRNPLILLKTHFMPEIIQKNLEFCLSVCGVGMLRTQLHRNALSSLQVHHKTFESPPEICTPDPKKEIKGPTNMRSRDQTEVEEVFWY